MEKKMIRMMWECKGCGKNAPCRLVELFEHLPELDPNDCPRGIANAEWKKCGECVVPCVEDDSDDGDGRNGDGFGSTGIK